MLGHLSKNDILNFIKKEYLKEVKFIGAEKEENIFVWKHNYIEITIILLSDEYSNEYKEYIGFLFYAKIVDSTNDRIKILDLRDKTYKFDFLHKLNGNGTVAISKLSGMGFFPDNPNNIIRHSIRLFNRVSAKDGLPLYKLVSYARKFANKEYDKVHSVLKEIGIPRFNAQVFFANKFDFENIIQTINNDQFSEELSECLWAYNNEKWFICAAGIGSIIEHLMMLTILNYNKTSMLKEVGRTPTAINYINAFKKEPLCINLRQEQYIRTLFQVRNSVNHYQTGYTNKDFVDTLLNGIRNMFNDYYVQSVKYKNRTLQQKDDSI